MPGHHALDRRRSTGDLTVMGKSRVNRPATPAAEWAELPRVNRRLDPRSRSDGGASAPAGRRLIAAAMSRDLRATSPSVARDNSGRRSSATQPGPDWAPWNALRHNMPPEPLAEWNPHAERYRSAKRDSPGLPNLQHAPGADCNSSGDEHHDWDRIHNHDLSRATSRTNRRASPLRW